MRRRKNRLGLGLAPEEHRERAEESLAIARRILRNAERDLAVGNCKKAHRDLNLAAMNFASASAHRASSGVGFDPNEQTHRKNLIRLEQRFAKKCLIHRS